MRRPVAQAFTQPAVELIVHPLHQLLAEARERLAFWGALNQETIAVFVSRAGS